MDSSRTILLNSSSRFVHCPLSTPMGVLGKKWTLLILRDLDYRKITRFTDLTASIGGITRRMLSARLYQLRKEGLIEKSGETHSWRLTPKGKDMMMVVDQLALFRMKWDANRVFGTTKTEKALVPSQLAP